MTRSEQRAARRLWAERRQNVLWGAMLVIAVAGGIGATFDARVNHPKPRPDAKTHAVLPASQFEGYARVQQVYAKAATIKETLDGIYCYCDCSNHAGHYSLLDCYASDHAAHCETCLSEAELVYKLKQEGKTLDEIRAAVDALYGA